jgi:hypothetical protein
MTENSICQVKMDVSVKDQRLKRLKYFFSKIKIFFLKRKFFYFLNINNLFFLIKN